MYVMSCNERRSLQCLQAIFLGMFLCLVVSGAALSILTMRSRETVEQLRAELNKLNSSYQIMELRGKVLNGNA